MLNAALADIGQNALLYALIGAGFYYASKSSRHLALAAAICFVDGPYLTRALFYYLGVFASLIISVIVCGLVGVAYRRASWQLQRMGMGSSQLLVLGIALVSLNEQVLVLWFGPTSITLLSENQGNNSLAASLSTSWGFLGTSALAIIAFVWLTSRTVLRRILAALWENPTGLRLLGVNAMAVETWVCGAGFSLVAFAGNLWSLSARVKPSMTLDIAVTSTVIVMASLALPRIRYVYLIAAAVFASCRITTQFVFQNDWSYSSGLLLALLIVAIGNRGRYAEETRS